MGTLDPHNNNFFALMNVPTLTNMRTTYLIPIGHKNWMLEKTQVKDGPVFILYHVN